MLETLRTICQSLITFSKFNAKIIANIEYILLLSNNWAN